MVSFLIGLQIKCFNEILKVSLDITELQFLPCCASNILHCLEFMSCELWYRFTCMFVTKSLLLFPENFI